jgi:tetratricopeptide (TPR) repeat protein
MKAFSLRPPNPCKKTSLSQKICLIFFGLLLLSVLLEVCLRVAGFAFWGPQELRNYASSRMSGTYRIMCVGESTTAMGGRYAYPNQLERILNEKSKGMKFSVINKGIVGVSSAVLLSKLEEDINKYEPDMVISLMGINDYNVCKVYIKGAPRGKNCFVESLRIYKFVKFILMRVVKKAEGIGLFKPNPDPRAFLAGSLSDRGYVILGRFYMDRGEFAEAEELFRKAIGLNPKNAQAFSGLGRCYNNLGKTAAGEEALKKASELNPKSEIPYIGLGWCYWVQREQVKAVEAFKAAINLNPKNASAYNGLGWCYLSQSELLKAEDAFQRAIQINPKDDSSYFGLGHCHKMQGRPKEAGEAYKKAIEVNPKNDRAYGALTSIFIEQRDFKLMEEYRNEAARIRGEYYNSMTIHNYRMLKQILDKRKIKLVCVQYPMLNIGPLKGIFENENGINFVDNEKIFKEAIQKQPYEEYFEDMFAGDFGHCTPKGNRLLAENIANAILKEGIYAQ